MNDAIAMKQFALLSTLLVACTGSSTYYPSGQPQYASTSQTTTSTNGTTTTTTTTSATFQSYEEPAPPPVEEPAPPPPASGDPRCAPQDSVEMCVSLGVILDVGDLLARADDRSCKKATKSLNRYADDHARQIETFMSLDRIETHRRLEQWTERHRVEATEAMNRALELASRCDDDRTDRALRRVGFRGIDNH